MKHVTLNSIGIIDGGLINDLLPPIPPSTPTLTYLVVALALVVVVMPSVVVPTMTVLVVIVVVVCDVINVETEDLLDRRAVPMLFGFCSLGLCHGR